VPFEWIEYQLCKKFSCLPSDLSNQSWEKISHFLSFINLEAEEEKRAQRKAMAKQKRFSGKYARGN